MTLMGIYGNVGYGKNIFAVDWLKEMVKIGIERQTMWESFSPEDRLKYFKNIQPPEIRGRANFHIEDFRTDPPTPIPNIRFMTTDEFLNLTGEEGIRYLIWIDEPYAWGLESRRSGSDIAVEMTKKSLQSRKTGIRSKAGRESGSDIGYSTQLPSSMDKRLKFLARSIFLALPPDEWGYHYLYMGKMYRILHISTTKCRKSGGIYDSYDTYEKIEVTFSEEYYKNAGVIEAGKQEDVKAIERGIPKVTNDQSLMTKDGIRIWKSLVRPDVWDEALKEGGKVEQTSPT